MTMLLLSRIIFFCLISTCNIFANDVFHLKIYHTGFAFSSGTSTNKFINTIIKLDFPIFNARITNFPTNCPYSNSPLRDYCQIYRLYSNGRKDLVVDYNEGRSMFIELMKHEDYPDIVVMPNPDNIYEAVYPIWGCCGSRV